MEYKYYEEEEEEDEGSCALGEERDQGRDMYNLPLVDSAVRDSVRVCILKHSKNQVINKSDFRELNIKFSSSVFEATKKHLKNVFGFDLVPLSTNTGLNSDASGRVSAIDKFVLVSCLSEKEKNYLSTLNESSLNNHGLISLVIAFIYLKGGRLPESYLYHILQQQVLKHSPDDKDATFGGVKARIRSYVVQKYLTRVKDIVLNSNQQEFYYEAGPRANLEFPLDNLRAWIEEV